MLAAAGVVWLLAPSAQTPDLFAALMMLAAGVAWGVYPLVGRGASDPVGQTARNFLVAASLAVPALALDARMPSLPGLLLATLAGVATSAFGYVLWYKIAPRLGLAAVASVQLVTP